MTARVCLVTGGSGFIGAHVVRLLCERGDRVRILDVAPAHEPDARVEMLQGSITDRPLGARALDGVDELYHVAGNPHLWTRRKSDYWLTHVVGTRTVLEEAERAGVPRIVYTSTESILKRPRHMPAHEPVDEKVEPEATDMPGVYCLSKLFGEREALAAAGRGLPVVVVNPTLPIGPGDHNLTPPTKMLLGFLNGRMPAYLECRFNLVDVRDVARGHLLAASRGRIGERYILGHENLTLSQLLNMIEELTGLAMPRRRIPYAMAYAVAAASEFLADHVLHRPPTAPLCGVRLAVSPMMFDCSKAVRELGLPQTPIRVALADAIAWLAERRELRRPLRPRLGRATPLST